MSARQTVLSLCALADQTTQQVFEEALQSHGQAHRGFVLLRLGGYGRKTAVSLFRSRHFVFVRHREGGADISSADFGFFAHALGHGLPRQLARGGRWKSASGSKKTILSFTSRCSTGDFLAGDSELFNRLDNRILPTSEKAARPFLLAQLHKLTKDRLNRYGNTIFHLEPNVKDAPGGLRDYQAAAWLRQIAENKQSLNITAAEEDLASGAVDFLSAIRCFLHYANASQRQHTDVRASGRGRRALTRSFAMAKRGTLRSGCGCTSVMRAH